MGRKRIHNKHLPRRLYLRHGTYRFAHADGRFERLGRDYGEALHRYAELCGPRSIHLATLGDAFDRYQREILPRKSPKSQQNNLQQFKPLRKVFGHMRPQHLRALHGFAYLDARRETPFAANLEIVLLKHVCAYLVRWGVLERSPMAEVKKLHVAPRDRDVQTWEFDAVRAMAAPRMQCAMDIARLTGLREGDILRLAREHITQDGLLIRTHKTGKRLLFTITPALAGLLDRLKGLDGKLASMYLFTGPRGQPLTSGGFQSEWKRLMARATRIGILQQPYHFNDLRALAAAEHPNPTKLLGHDSPATTKTYLRRPTKVTPAR